MLNTFSLILESRKITENIELTYNTSQPPGARVPPGARDTVSTVVTKLSEPNYISPKVNYHKYFYWKFTSEFS